MKLIFVYYSFHPNEVQNASNIIDNDRNCFIKDASNNCLLINSSKSNVIKFNI